MKLKTKKTVAKRFKFTKSGKVIKRYCGQDHFNARDTGKITRKKRRSSEMDKTLVKTIKILSNQL
jgi:ribosomal protein L35